MAQVLVRIDGRLAPASVFISTGNEVLLGAEALELLDITVDPRRRRLRMGKPFGLKAAWGNRYGPYLTDFCHGDNIGL